MEEYQPQENKTALYNSGLAETFRVDNLWQQFSYYVQLGGRSNYIRANEILDCVFGDLSGDTTDKDIKNFDRFKRKIIRNMYNRALFRQILLEKQRWLKQLQNTQGKGTAYQEDLQSYMKN